MSGEKRMDMSVERFHMPRYNEIPNVGLYLKQVVKLINESLEPFFHISVTETMLSNYVKKHLVSNPVKKQYYREQIAPLFFIVLAKTVVSLDDIQLLLKMQEASYEPQVAYEYFCNEFENILHYVYGVKSDMEQIGSEESEEKTLLRNLIITIAYKCYLEDEFREIENRQSPVK